MNYKIKEKIPTTILEAEKGCKLKAEEPKPILLDKEREPKNNSKEGDFLFPVRTLFS